MNFVVWFVIEVLLFIAALITAYVWRNETLKLRAAIRKHRDQRLDDRCWMDDFELYEALPEGLDNQVDPRLLPREEMLRNCMKFVNFRTTSLSHEMAIKYYQDWKKQGSK